MKVPNDGKRCSRAFLEKSALLYRKPVRKWNSAPDMYEHHKKQQVASTVFWDSTVQWVVLIMLHIVVKS
jgi:hypothetical protein